MIINGESRCIKCMSVLLNDNKEICTKCGYMQSEYISAPRCLRAGTVLADKYTIGSVIGEGSFGITYLGWDNILEIKVAVKEYFPVNMVSRDTLNGGSPDVYVFSDINENEYKTALDKFLEEARILAHFKEYEGIVSVRDFFYANNTAYMVMEYVEGESLGSIIKKTESFEPAYVLELMRPMLETLHEVHSKGLIHRDISPDNILVRNDNKLVLIDFGSARMHNTSSERELTVSFKRGFSPEEQYRTDGIQGSYSDIYAICALIYYMITGEMPVESVQRLISDTMKPIKNYDNISLTTCQKDAITKGMALNAGDRYQDVKDLIRDLYSTGESGLSAAVYIKVSVAVIVFVISLFAAFNIYIRLNDNSGNDNNKYISTVMPPEASDPAAPEPARITVTQTPAPQITPAAFELDSFKGMTVKKAKKIIEGYNCGSLELVITRQYNDKVKKNRIIKQSIEAGIKLDMYSPVTLTLYVSKGSNKAEVPGISGLRYEDARQKLASKGLKYTENWVYSDVEKGYVISQDAPEGTRVKKGTYINYTISLGKNESNRPKKTAGPKDDDFAGEIF